MSIRVFRDSVAGTELVGRIDYERGRFASFAYDQAYATRAREHGEIGISERLPIASQPYDEEAIAPFLQGLLPEGPVLDNLVRLYQVPRNDYLTLIEQLGCESIGALTFLSDAVDGSEYQPGYERLTTAMIDDLRSNPTHAATTAASSTRLSLSGAQSKVAWSLPEGIDAEEAALTDWAVPCGTAPSSHIIKVSRRGEEDLAINELACAAFSESCGIETARVALVPDIPGAIAIRRYDRAWTGTGTRRLMRLHQEDFCQALGLPPYYKYQPEGVEADYVVYAADLIDATAETPGAARLEFAKRLVFNYLIGNTDAHLKNSSILYNGTWTARRLAPAYDITCIPLSGYSTRMPFDIGSHRGLDEVDERDVLAIALDMDVSLDAFDRVLRELLAGFDAPRMDALDCESSLMMERIADNARPRIGLIERFLRG